MSYTPQKKSLNEEGNKTSRNKEVNSMNMSDTPSFDCTSQDQYLNDLQRCLQLSMSHRKKLEDQSVIQSNRLSMLKVKEKCV